MSLATDAALESLSESAKPVGDPRQGQRIDAVQALLSDDFAWVERTLSEVVELGEAPATAAARHLVANGGKRVRPTSALLCAACFGKVPAAVREMAVVVELVHSSTLLHDDVIDEGMERRGAPTSRLMWGNAISVLAGDVLLVHALKRTQEAAPELMSGLLDMLFRLVSGEIVQLRGRTELDVSEQTYDRILQDKTASLFRFSAAAGARLSGATSEQQEVLGRFGERIGMAFQLVDDVLDYSGENTGKALGTDLREGKMTLPLVLAMKEEPSLIEQVRAIHGGDDRGVEALRRRVAGSGVCERIRTRAEQQTQGAIDALSSLKPTPAKALLVEIARHLARRGR